MTPFSSRSSGPPPLVPGWMLRQLHRRLPQWNSEGLSEADIQTWRRDPKAQTAVEEYLRVSGARARFLGAGLGVAIGAVLVLIPLAVLALLLLGGM